MSEIPRGLNKPIEFPENYEDIKKKYLEREDEKLKELLIRRNAKSESELIALAKKAIEARSYKISSEYKELQNRNVQKETKSVDILKLKNDLSEEIDTTARRILEEFPKDTPSLEEKAPGPKQLKGRVSQNPHEG